MSGQQLTEADLENMSPEQIAELQKKNCIFCHIINGRIPSKKIYEDEMCLAILDINPASKGHMLLIPKEHHVILQMLPEPIIKHLGKITKMLSKTAIRGLGAEGTNILIASGAIAGQKSPHAMIHIIPRNENDHITCFELPEKSVSISDLFKIQKMFAEKLGTNLEAAKEVIRTEERKTEELSKKIETKSAQTSGKKYITSEKAKRFHVASCPFAEKIPESSRIYMDEKTAMKTKDPCSCTKLEPKKISLDELEEMLE